MKKIILILLMIFIVFVSGCIKESTCDQLGGFSQIGLEGTCPSDAIGIKTKDVCKSCICCAPRNNEKAYTCDEMYKKFNCEGKTASECGKDPYVRWAKENCGLGTKERPIG